MSSPPRGRAAAQHRANRIRAFREELAALRAEGVDLLSPAQEDALARHHDAVLGDLRSRFDVDISDAAGRLSRGMQLASFFGALTLTAAIYALVARFWGDLDLPIQIGLLALFPMLSLAGVDLAARREPTLYVSAIFAAAAYGTFWLAAVMTARLLDLPLTVPVLWLGVAFGLVLAMTYGFRIVLVATLLAVVVALAGTVLTTAGAPWTMASRRLEPALLAALGLPFLAPGLEAASPGFGAIARRVGLIVGLLLMLWLSLSGDASALPFPITWVEGIYQAMMLMVTVSLIALGLSRRWTDVVNIASAALAIFLLTRYVDWFWSALPRYLFFLVLAAAAFGWLLALRRLRSRAEARA